MKTGFFLENPVFVSIGLKFPGRVRKVRAKPAGFLRILSDANLYRHLRPYQIGHIIPGAPGAKGALGAALFVCAV
jgi:hypothetical protein